MSFEIPLLVEVGYCLFSSIWLFSGLLRLFAAAVWLFSLHCVLLEYSKT
jgi:hypothetical protein